MDNDPQTKLSDASTQTDSTKATVEIYTPNSSGDYQTIRVEGAQESIQNLSPDVLKWMADNTVAGDHYELV